MAGSCPPRHSMIFSNSNYFTSLEIGSLRFCKDFPRKSFSQVVHGDVFVDAVENARANCGMGSIGD
jgi:hypothetical protein